MRRVFQHFPSGLLRAAATQPPKPLPWRLPPSARAAAVSTVSGGHPTSAVSSRNADPTAVSTNTLEEERQLEVLWEDHTSHYDWTWLRVNCPSFVHEGGHRTVFPGDVDPDLKPVEVAAADSLMSITWSDGHVSSFKTNWLRDHDNSPSALHERDHGSSPTPLCAWDAIPKVDGRQYMEDDEALYAALQKVNRAGVVLLENVGVEDRAVLDLARRVGPISHQGTYGEMFDITSQDNAWNASLANEYPRLHMSLSYYESPPGLQFLHCLRFDAEVKDGSTTFMDAFAAAEHFRDNFPEKFEVLSRIHATFEMVREPTSNAEGEDRNLEALAPSQIETQKPIFQVSATGELLAVNWAPMFEGVLMCAAKDMASYHSAHSEFLHLIEEGRFAESHTLRKRLEPGQCLVFNNRRMLHGREPFSQSGDDSQRRLQGTFVTADDAMSTLCSLRVNRSSGGSGDSAASYLTRFGNGSLPRVC